MNGQKPLLIELAYKGNTVIFVLSLAAFLVTEPGSSSRVISTLSLFVTMLTYVAIVLTLRYLED